MFEELVAGRLIMNEKKKEISNNTKRCSRKKNQFPLTLDFGSIKKLTKEIFKFFFIVNHNPFPK